MSDSPSIRDLIPRDRVSLARIRTTVSSHSQIGSWSRRQRGAIRPSRLAELIRYCLLAGLTMPIEQVEAALRSTSRKSCSHAYEIEVEIAPGQVERIDAGAEFTLTPAGRVRVLLTLGGIAITSGIVIGGMDE